MREVYRKVEKVTPEYINRKEGLAWLAEVHGLKISPRYFQKLSLPSRAEGPAPDLIFMGRHLYKPETLLNWAMARAKKTAKD